IESLPRHKGQWPYIGSLVDYFDDKRSGGQAPLMPRNVALPFVMGSKNEIPPLAGPYGAMLGVRYDPGYTEVSGAGTTLAPEIRPNQAFKDPLFGIEPTDTLQLAGATLPKDELHRFDLRRALLEQFGQARRDLDAHERIGVYSQQQQTAFSLVTS